MTEPALASRIQSAIASFLVSVSFVMSDCHALLSSSSSFALVYCKVAEYKLNDD